MPGKLMVSMNDPCAAQSWWGPDSSRAAPGRGGPFLPLVLFFTRLFAGPLASQRSLHALLLAGLQVKGVSFDLLDNVFLLHLALEPAKSVLEGFSLLKSNFCQTYTPPNSSGWTSIYDKILTLSQEERRKSWRKTVPFWPKRCLYRWELRDSATSCILSGAARKKRKTALGQSCKKSRFNELRRCQKMS
jgi:hypothetical protein